MAEIDFWYSIGSTYSWLTVSRLPGVAAETGLAFRWRPFNVRQVMTEQKNIPFAGKPAKTAYMWRDIERRAGMYGLSGLLPAPYPITDLPLANAIALLGTGEGWCAEFTQAVYRRWFSEGLDAGAEPNLSDSLAEIGQDPVRVLAEARGAPITEALAAETRRAMDLGVFGSPSFIMGKELFWGDDRLGDAISWARTGRVA